MPIIIALLLVLLGMGWFGKKHESPHRHHCAPPVARMMQADPPVSYQDRCRARFEDAQRLLVGKAMLRDGESRTAEVSLWKNAEIRVEGNPGGEGGVWLTLKTPDGGHWGAGVSPRQPAAGEKYPAWHDFGGAPDKVSLFKDAGDRSGFVAAVDPDDARRADFVETMQAAVDECLAMPAGE